MAERQMFAGLLPKEKPPKMAKTGKQRLVRAILVIAVALGVAALLSTIYQSKHSGLNVQPPRVGASTTPENQLPPKPPK